MKRLLWIPLLFLCSTLWAADIDGPALCMSDPPSVCGKVEPVQLARIPVSMAGGGASAAASVCDLGYGRTGTFASTDTWGAGTAFYLNGGGTGGALASSCTSSTMAKGCMKTGSTTAVDFKMCVYQYVDINTGTKIACSNAIQSNTVGWQTLTFDSNFSISSGTNYIIMNTLKSDSGTITKYYNSTAKAIYYKAGYDVYGTGPSNIDWEAVNFTTYAAEGEVAMFVTDGTCP